MGGSTLGFDRVQSLLRIERGLGLAKVGDDTLVPLLDNWGVIERECFALGRQIQASFLHCENGVLLTNGDQGLLAMW